MLKRVLLSLGLGAVLATVAQAAEPRVEVTPFFTHRAGGGFQDANNNDVNLSAKSGAAIAIDWAASEHGAQYELLYSKQNTTVSVSAQNPPAVVATPPGMKIEYLQIGGTTLLGDESAHVVPFAAGGIGAMRLSPADPSLTQETRWAFNLGGGVRIPIVKHVRLRLEARGYLSWLDGSSSLFCNTSTASTPCALRGRGQTFFQYDVLGGVSFGF